MKKIVLISLLLIFALTSCVKDKPFTPEDQPTIKDSSLKGKLVLNEINGTGKDADRYIELYNLSEETIKLKDISIYYNNISSAPDITWKGKDETISPKGFLLLKGTKKDKNPGHDLIKGLSGSQAINLEIRDASGNRIDFFEVGAEDGRKKSYARIPDGTGEWYFEDPKGSPGASNGTNTEGKSPIVSSNIDLKISRDISAPTSDDDVKISAILKLDTDNSISSVILKWSTNGKEQSDINMALKESSYTATIPKQENKTKVEYTVVATDKNGKTAQKSDSYIVKNNETPDDPIDPIDPVDPEDPEPEEPIEDEIDYTLLVINEVDGNNKFVEIYNKGSVDISLEGVSLVKNEKQTWWTGGDAAKIKAGGYYAIGQEEKPSEEASENTGASGISAKKTLKFQLKNPQGEVINDFTRSKGELNKNCTPDYSEKAPDGGGKYSFSRCPDGSGDFKLAVPSINKKNPDVGEDDIITELSN